MHPLALLLIVAGVTTGPIDKAATGFQFTEGPVWVTGSGLLFSDIPANKIYKLPNDVFREDSGNSNGLILDNEGRLLAAEHGNRRVSRTEKDGSITVIADKFEGKRLNSPNDMAVRKDGVIFFTDPPYGLEGGPEGPNAELDFSGVYCVKPGEAVRLLAKDFKRPNGIGLSPDQKTLYVADTEGQHIRSFVIKGDADPTVEGGAEFYKLPFPDGMVVHPDGRIFCTAGDGVHVISPKGERIEVIEFPEHPANCTLGGDDGQTLYATARTSVYSVRVK